MIFLILTFVVSVLKGEFIANREALRAKLLDAQNVMRFDQVEFDRLWNLAISNGKLPFKTTKSVT